MAASGRKNIDTALLLALSRGLTVRVAAKKASCGERTVYRRMADPAFQEKLRETKEKLIAATADRLTGLGTKAVRRLNKLMGDGIDAKVQLGACKAVLELAARWRENHEFAERVAELEAQAMGREKGQL